MPSRFRPAPWCDVTAFAVLRDGNRLTLALSAIGDSPTQTRIARMMPTESCSPHSALAVDHSGAVANVNLGSKADTTLMAGMGRKGTLEIRLVVDGIGPVRKPPDETEREPSPGRPRICRLETR